MGDQGWWDEERVRQAAAGAGRRAGAALVIASLVLLCVAAYGISLYPKLPDRIPYTLSGPSPSEMRPTGFLPKNPLTTFGLLLFGAAWMVVAWKVEARRDWVRWPGWEGAGLLTPEHREYVFLPLREAWRWAGATVGVAMALAELGVWEAALRRPTGLAFWPFLVGVLLAMAEMGVGGVVANRRRKAVLGSGQ